MSSRAGRETDLRRLPPAYLDCGSIEVFRDEIIDYGGGLARSGVSAVICLAADGDDILTSDPDDLRALAEAADVHVGLIRV